MVNFCAVYGCLSTKHDKTRRFHRFPRDKARCRKWVTACNRLDLAMKSEEHLYNSNVVCDLHFERSCRINSKLKCNAIPTLNLSTEEFFFVSKSTQTDELELNSTGTISMKTKPRPPSTSCKRKVTSEYKAEFKKRKTLDYGPKDIYITPQLHIIIELQKKLQPHSRGKRYSKEFKLFALRAFFSGPTAYRVLSKIVSLPSERVLYGINLNTGSNFFLNVINCLESKLEHLKESDKYCVICVDSIPLKSELFYQVNLDKVVGLHEINGFQTTEPATQAFVIMIRGVFRNWEQPLVYLFLAQSKNTAELNEWLNYVISEIMRIGYKVIAFNTNQESNFFHQASSRNVTVQMPYFFVNGHKIYYIFDVLHLLKSLRNMLLKYNIEYQRDDGTKAIASWNHIEKFYALDTKRDYQLAPKLTESHINPNMHEKKMVKYAAQVFSKTVAAGMNCAIELGELKQKCIGTVTLIELINNSFDILNSSVEGDTNISSRSFAGLPYQIQTLNQFYKFLNDARIHKTDNLKDVNTFERIRKGFMVSLASIMSLWEDLNSQGKEFILTQRLHQDVLGDFLDSVRRQSGSSRVPTPVQFSKAFRKVLMQNMLKYSKNARCKEDMDNLLRNWLDLVPSHVADDEESLQCVNDMIVVNQTDCKFDIPIENPLNQVCNCLLGACHNIHKCDGINAYVKYLENNNKDEDGEIRDNSSCEMSIPPESFINFVRELDKCVVNVFDEKVLKGCLAKEILNAQRNITFDDCCPCFPTDYLKKVFVLFRIDHIITHNNRRLSCTLNKEKNIIVPDLELKL